VRVAAVTAGAVCLTFAAFAPSEALGARQPSLSEREAITRTLPAFLRRAPVECLFVKITVSTRNSRYALVVPQVINRRGKQSPCLKYAGNGFCIVKKTRIWRIIYEGSDPPPCSLRVPRDITACLRVE
jgi:hypothetical protein